jgi:hypothetical protein
MKSGASYSTIFLMSLEQQVIVLWHFIKLYSSTTLVDSQLVLSLMPSRKPFYEYYKELLLKGCQSVSYNKQ